MADIDSIAPKHEPVNVSEEMAEATQPEPERISRPSNPAAVDRIATSESRPRE